MRDGIAPSAWPRSLMPRWEYRGMYLKNCNQLEVRTLREIALPSATFPPALSLAHDT
jgi:hypothetical protein